MELGLQRVTGVHWGERLLPRKRQLDSPRYGPNGVVTSSIDLLDEGPTVCRLGVIVRSGERCRFPDTRSEFVVDADGSARTPTPQPGTIAADTQRSAFLVPFLHGAHRGSSAGRVAVERLEHGGFLVTRMGRDLLQPVNGADCGEGLLVPFGHYCGLTVTTGGGVWFVVYPSGLAHFTLRSHELSWVGDLELHAETNPVGYLPHYAIDAVREATGWRITRMIAPPPTPLALLPGELEDCAPGQILQPGDRCSDPTTTAVFGITADGGWADDGGLPRYEAISIGTSSHPNGTGLGFQPLATGRWLITGISHHPDDPAQIGLCTIGLIVYPREACSQTGGIWFAVFGSGLAFSVNATSFERINIVGHTVRYGSGAVAQYDLTAERQSDGGFLITWMRERWPVLESRVRRERGDCLPGLILSAGDGCRYPNSRELLVVSQDGSVSFGAVGGRYPDGFRFVPWGGVTQESVLFEALRDGRGIVLRIGADTPRSIGSCVVGLSLAPGQSCSTGSREPTFYVFDDAASYDGVAARDDLNVEAADGAPGLRAERQPDRSYIIRQLG